MGNNNGCEHKFTETDPYVTCRDCELPCGFCKDCNVSECCQANTTIWSTRRMEAG